MSSRKKGAHQRSEKTVSRRGQQAKAHCVKTAIGQLDFGDMCTEDEDVAGAELEETDGANH